MRKIRSTLGIQLMRSSLVTMSCPLCAPGERRNQAKKCEYRRPALEKRIGYQVSDGHKGVPFFALEPQLKPDSEWPSHTNGALRKPGEA